MSKAKIIKDAFSRGALELGFNGKGLTYRKTLDEVIWVVELMKDRGTLYGIGSGVWVRHLPGNDALLKEWDQTENTVGFSSCHVRPDIGRLSKTKGKYALKVLLDSQSKIEDEERRDRIKFQIEQFLIPAFLELSTASDCCENYKRLDFVGLWRFNLGEFCQSFKKGVDTRKRPVRKKK